MSKIKTAEFSLPTKAKPSRALGRDHTRPHLCAAYIAPKEGDKATLYATDSYKMVALVVQATGDVESQYLSGEALREAEKTGRFQVGEFVEPLDRQGHANGVLFRKPKDLKEPIDFEELFAKRLEPKRKFTVGLNAEFLHQLADAMGADGVMLTFDAEKPLGTILVQPLNSGARVGDSRALLMPIRLNV